MSQLGLFPPPPLDLRADVELATRRPACVRFGTSSWTFPGWGGLVYPGNPSMDELVARGLETYAKHPLLNTVAITRSYYQALSPEVLRGYAAQLPSGYRCVTKVWNAVTMLADPRTRARNPHFFDPGFFTDAVLAPSEAAFSEHQGPFLFQLPPMGARDVPKARDFAATLDRFFSKLPTRFAYGVEVRNEALLSPAYFDVLRTHRVSHTFSQWERLPPIQVQRELAGPLGARHTLCRLMMPIGMPYETARDVYAPYDRLDHVDQPMRDDVVALTKQCHDEGRVVWVLVDNKAEGCAPLTIRGITQQLVERFGAATSG